METPEAKIQPKNEGGRPTKKTDLTLQKLEQAFMWGCTDKEACLYANISEKTLYNYQAIDQEFLQRKELLKQMPILKARSAVVNALEDNTELALKFLERRKKDEFNPRLTDADSNNNEGILRHLAEAALKYKETELQQKSAS